jgi:aryl-alcohol dehydrogenase-like predicted oxidoreductase
LGGIILQKYRIGKTGIEVSMLGLGTVKIGRQQGVHYPNAFELPTDNELNQLLGCAFDLEINLLDTAPAYGTSEERLGRALRGKRQDWILSTKAGEEFVNGVSRFDFSPLAIQKSIERSLERLQTDYLDIVLIHSNGDEHTIVMEENVFETLERLRDSGKLRAYGMSTKTVAGGMQTIDHAHVAMVTLNPNHTSEREVIEYAHQKQKSIFIKKAFASGHLPAEDSLRFAIAEPGVTSVIVGTINPEHLKQNVASILNHDNK